MFLKVALLLVVVLTGNVAIGALTGAALFEDLGEMLLLLAASLAFVIAVLKKQAQSKLEIKIQGKLQSNLEGNL